MCTIIYSTLVSVVERLFELGAILKPSLRLGNAERVAPSKADASYGLFC